MDSRPALRAAFAAVALLLCVPLLSGPARAQTPTTPVLDVSGVWVAQEPARLIGQRPVPPVDYRVTLFPRSALLLDR